MKRAILVLVMCCIPLSAWGADTNVHHGTGHVIGVMIANTDVGVETAEIFVLTAYPLPARVLEYDCQSSRSQAVRDMCTSIVSSVPVLLDGCAEVQHAQSSTEGQTINYWMCEDTGACVGTWSELGDTNADGIQLPEIQTLNVLPESSCTVRQ